MYYQSLDIGNLRTQSTVMIIHFQITVQGRMDKQLLCYIIITSLQAVLQLCLQKNSRVSKNLIHNQQTVCHSLLSRIQSAQTTTMSGNGNHIVGNGLSKDSPNADPFIYVCGKCPREFGSAAERDSHKANCNRPPNTSGETQCIHDANSFPTGSDET
jgi:hypothetical protein